MLKQILHSKLSIGIEHGTDSIFKLVTLNKVKNELNLEKKQTFTSFDTLCKALLPQSPLFLIFNDEQVLSKELIGLCDTSENAVQQAFPNLQQEEFYYEVLQGEQNTFISICRKIAIDTLLQKYQEANCQVIGFSLGNLLVSEILNYTKEESLYTSNARISTNKSKITTIKYNQENSKESLYDINGLNIDSDFVLAFAGGLRYFTQPGTALLHNFSRLNTKLLQNFASKRNFNLGLKVGLAFFFSLLLLNFLFYSYYENQINTLGEELQVNKSYKKSFINLKDNVAKKKKLVEEFSSSSSKVSLYLDQIGLSLPKSILLLEISYQPLEQKIKANEAVEVESNKIIIKGNTINPAEFSVWIKYLEQLDWTSDVSIQHYGKDSRNKTTFALYISMKPS